MKDPLQFKDAFKWSGSPYTEESGKNFESYVCRRCSTEIWLDPKLPTLSISLPAYIIDHGWPTPEEIKEALQIVRRCCNGEYKTGQEGGDLIA